MPSVVLRLAKVCAHGKRADRWFERAGRVRREHSTGDRGRGVFNGRGGAHQNRGERMRIEVPRQRQVESCARLASASGAGKPLPRGGEAVVHRSKSSIVSWYVSRVGPTFPWVSVL